MKPLLIAAVATLMLANSAQAVPLFGESAGTIRHGILTLHKDHQQPNKVYFFPNSTKFSVDSKGIPLFNFVYWGLNDPNATDKGAFMTMTSHLAMDNDQKKALDAYMEEYPEMEVAVLPIKSSTVGLQTTIPGAQPLTALFTEFNFSRVGGRAEDEIGINAVMTPVGARAFKALFSNITGGSSMKFDYCYIIQGFGPNMDASISIDMKRVYEYFEGSHSGGWGWFSWNIKTVIEKLKEDHVITIKMNGGDAKEWEVLNKVAETVTARLFVPELSATPVHPSSGNRLFNFGAGYVKKEELKKETWHWQRRDLEEREFCTAVVLKDLEPYKSKLITSAD